MRQVFLLVLLGLHRRQMVANQQKQVDKCAQSLAVLEADLLKLQMRRTELPWIVGFAVSQTCAMCGCTVVC